MFRLTKRQFRDRLGFKTDAAIAKYFDISGAAVAQWGEDDFIPAMRQLLAERESPELFAEPMPGPVEKVA